MLEAAQSFFTLLSSSSKGRGLGERGREGGSWSLTGA